MSIETTLQYLEFAPYLATVSRPHRVPRGKPSLVPEIEYARRLVAWVDELRQELSLLPSLMRDASLIVRTDESPQGRRVKQLTGPVRRKVEADPSRLEPEIARAGRAVAASHKRVLDRQTKAALGVEIPVQDRQVPEQIERFVSKNMTRIRSLGDKLISEVESIMLDAWDKGWSEAEVAAEIEKRIGIAEKHARFIARDQMTTLYAQVTRARHDEIGVRIFRWWTQDDGKVRKHHAVKHGRIFPYLGSRAPSFFPGDERGCRCWEEPVFDEIKARHLAGKGRSRR